MLSTSSHVYSELFIHLNWHCKEDQPFIHPELEKALYSHVENYCQKTRGIRFLGIGGTSDHIHLVIQIEPFLCLADWIGKVKGASSHDLNQSFGQGSLFWQRGYGALSFARRDLKGILRYVGDQKRHHSQGSTNEAMEKSGETIEFPEDKPES